MNKNTAIFLFSLCVTLFLLGCSTKEYFIYGTPTEPEKGGLYAPVPVGNIFRGDLLYIDITWNDEPYPYYILPPWLEKSLNTAILVIDMPISIGFDIIMSPYQLYQYYTYDNNDW